MYAGVWAGNGKAIITYMQDSNANDNDNADNNSNAKQITCKHFKHKYFFQILLAVLRIYHRCSISAVLNRSIGGAHHALDL